MRDNIVYIQSKEQISIEESTILKVKDLVTVVGDKSIIKEIYDIDIVDLRNYSNDYLVVSMMMIIERVKAELPEVDFNIVGKDEMLLRVKKENTNSSIVFEWGKVLVVCVVLFLGAALAITHFHADVNMSEAHSQIYKLITGKEVEKPILLQISYSLGIGIGMTVFFYHISPKRLKNEPNPLDIELYSYKKSLEEYILDQEKNKV